jgi:hypothetical protein
MYAKYIKERTSDHIFENDYGFATFRFLDDGKTVYIIDIFIEEKQRQSGKASLLADLIVSEAKLKGATKLIGSVVPSTKNSTTSMKVLLGYGMVLDSAADNLIIFRKDI